MQMSHKFKRSCQWAVIGGFRSVLFAKHVERWMAKDIGYARNTESGYVEVVSNKVWLFALFCTLAMFYKKHFSKLQGLTK